MNGKESDIVLKMNNIVNQLLSGKSKVNIDLSDIESIEDEGLKSLAGKLAAMAEEYAACYSFMVDLSRGRLYTEPPRNNTFANPFKQLHSELRHLTWQIQEIADGDYNQRVSFSGDFSDAINKMIDALRERQVLSERIKENENLFRSIFSTSPDGIVLCDLDHYIINASNAAYRMLHLNDGIIGKILFSDLIHPEDKATFKWFFNSLQNNGGRTLVSELRVVSPNGENFWIEQNASILLDSNSQPKGYIIIIRDISERKLAEAQLLQYTDELDESNKTKDKLFSIIAHDLKSPFNSLLGFSDMLEQEVNKADASVEKIKKYSKIINTSASKTFDLLINLLEWSRLQSDRIVVKPEYFDLNDLIIYNMDIGHTLAISKNITLEYTTQGDYPIISDRAIINTILRNLISNAIKYTQKNGYIAVSVILKNDTYQISVQDNGAGISKENLEKLFKLSNIESTPGTANEKGTGLGLLLCKDFVHKIGGDIWVKSTYGHGATFTFSLKNI